MKISKNKIATIIIAVFFVLSIATPMNLVSNVSAHNPPITIPNYVYLNAYPTPDGVGQPISLWLGQLIRPQQ